MDLTPADRPIPASPLASWLEELFGGEAIVTYLPSGPTLVLSRLDPATGDRFTLTFSDETGDPNPGLHAMGCAHCRVLYGEMTTGHATRGDGTECWDVRELERAPSEARDSYGRPTSE